MRFKGGRECGNRWKESKWDERPFQIVGAANTKE